MTYLVHGEVESAHVLQERIGKELGWKARVAHYLEEVNISHPL
jgi:hypothetical protein